MAPKTQRSGLTLTELLVVVAILVAVTAVLAPLLTSPFEGREIREAARQINAYFQQAQMRAKELGRPVGVVLRRAPSETALTSEQDFVYQLSLAEEPPPYRGESAFSMARVAVTGTAGTNSGVLTGTAMIRDTSFRFFAEPNDLIRFNLRGPKYRILTVTALDATANGGFSFEVTFDQRTENTAGVRFAAANLVSFEVFRRPRATTSTPLELSAGSAIVMNLSGVGTNVASQTTLANGSESSVTPLTGPLASPYVGLVEFQRATEDEFPAQISSNLPPNIQDLPLTIMFNPNGGVDRIYRVMPTDLQAQNPAFDLVFASLPPKRPQDKIFLFVGKAAENRVVNLSDGNNIWVAIDPQTGSVTTAPNVLPLGFDATTATDVAQLLPFVAGARQIAATGQSMGGN